MKMKKNSTLWALVFVNLGVFLATATLLPKRGSWSSTGPLSYFINSRHDWGMAWGILLASILISIGIYLFLHARGAFDTGSGSGESTDEK
jgi:hypothetical protein